MITQDIQLCQSVPDLYGDIRRNLPVFKNFYQIFLACWVSGSQTGNVCKEAAGVALVGLHPIYQYPVRHYKLNLTTVM